MIINDVFWKLDFRSLGAGPPRRRFEITPAKIICVVYTYMRVYIYIDTCMHIYVYCLLIWKIRRTNWLYCARRQLILVHPVPHWRHPECHLHLEHTPAPYILMSSIFTWTTGDSWLYLLSRRLTSASCFLSRSDQNPETTLPEDQAEASPQHSPTSPAEAGS